MTPNWFADGQHIIELAVGASFGVLHVYAAWRSTRNARDIDTVRHLVIDGSEAVLSEVQTAKSAMDRVAAMIGDRRKNPPTYAAGGRRATDPPSP